jgi:hypothetical protein
LSHIRLAERRGIFQRPHLSPVQTAALEALMLWEDIIEQRQERERLRLTFRLGIIGKDPDEVLRAFPELKGGDDDGETEELTTDQDAEEIVRREMEGQATEWVHEGEAPEPQEVEQLLRQLTSGSVQMSEADIEGGWV